MDRPEIIHQYVVTYDGLNPDETRRALLFADTYDGARAEYIDWAIEHNLPLDNVTFWYQLTAMARSNWTPVGEDTDTDELMDVIWNEFQTKTAPEVFGSHPGSPSEI
ncbi:hypothetical protein [Actinomyces succiniciruminis]|nr:hypothetical protein [Actinomyces succiniciruminis]